MRKTMVRPAFWTVLLPPALGWIPGGCGRNIWPVPLFPLPADRLSSRSLPAQMDVHFAIGAATVSGKCPETFVIPGVGTQSLDKMCLEPRPEDPSQASFILRGKKADRCINFLIGFY